MDCPTQLPSEILHAKGIPPVTQQFLPAQAGNQAVLAVQEAVDLVKVASIQCSPDLQRPVLIHPRQAAVLVEAFC